jgi:hypothetical protein
LRINEYMARDMKVLENISGLLEEDNNATKCVELFSLTKTVRLAE